MRHPSRSPRRPRTAGNTVDNRAPALACLATAAWLSGRMLDVGFGTRNIRLRQPPTVRRLQAPAFHRASGRERYAGANTIERCVSELKQPRAVPPRIAPWPR